MAILRIKNENGEWVGIPSIEGPPGQSGVYVGSGEPDTDANVRIDPNAGGLTMEVWRFEMKDGTVVEKEVLSR